MFLGMLEKRERGKGMGGGEDRDVEEFYLPA